MPKIAGLTFMEPQPFILWRLQLSTRVLENVDLSTRIRITYKLGPVFKYYL